MNASSRADRVRRSGRPLLAHMVVAWSLASLAAAQTQNITIAAVTNSADFQQGLPQKGSVASLFVTGLTGGGGVITATHYPLLNALNGISVWINFLPAPILAIAFLGGYQQINVQVPWEGLRDPLYVEVFQNGIRAHTEVAYTGGNLFGLSVFFADGNGNAVASHSDHSLVTAGSPAHPGETITAYGINLGPVSNTPASGAPAPLIPTAVPIAVAPVCSFSDSISWFPGPSASSPLSLPVLSDGLLPGTVGLYQISFAVPSLLMSGNVPVRFVRNLQLNDGGCPGIGSQTQLLTQESLPVTIPVGQ